MSVATTLAQICCHNNQLPQGAPTSTVLSNMICRGLDYDLTSLAASHNCTYSRYEDDMTFSSNIFTFPAAIGNPELGPRGSLTIPGEQLVAVIENHGVQVNTAKTRLQLNDRRRSGPGLVVNGK